MNDYKLVDEGKDFSFKIEDLEVQFKTILNNEGKEVFHITKDGDIIQDGVDITNDDVKVADCLRTWAEIYAGIKVKPNTTRDAYTEDILLEIRKQLELPIGYQGRSYNDAVRDLTDLLKSVEALLIK